MSIVIEKAMAATARMERPKEFVEGAVSALAELEQRKEALLPVEEHARKILNKEIAELTLKGKQARFAAEHGYPMVSPEVLTWRGDKINGIPTPRLSLISINEQTMNFRSKGSYSDYSKKWSSEGTKINLPKGLAAYFGDVSGAMNQLAVKKKSNIELTHKCVGVIPDDVREYIQTGKRKNLDLYLLSDAPEETWHYAEKKVARPPKPRNLDPLVLAYEANTLWLVTRFDLTPVEKYIELEFTTQYQLTAGTPESATQS